MIMTPFGFRSTASEVLEGIDLSGKTILITGGAAGIGLETTRALAAAGAEVTVAVRRVQAAEEIIAELRATTGNDRIHVRWLDLADRSSVKEFVAAWQGPLDVLINNAGIMALPEHETTPEGWEMQFATNYLGHFALTVGLHRALASAKSARIVSLSSSAHAFSPVNFDDLHFRFIPYSPWVAYGQSKTANILLAVEASRRWAGDGICANALNPGAIPTGLQEHIGAMRTPPHLRKTPAQGAATTVLLAGSPLVDGVAGRYFENCNEGSIVERRPTDFTGGVAAYALDSDNARRLWNVADSIIGFERS